MGPKRGGGRRGARASGPSKDLRECLERACGMDGSEASLSDCGGDLEAEWRVVKRAHLAKVLKEHPDKGGDADVFLVTREAWEQLHSAYVGQEVTTFVVKKGAKAVPMRGPAGPAPPPPSSAFYESAAEDLDPPYCCEAARSARSTCIAKGKLDLRHEDSSIAKGELRIGAMNADTGSYGWWRHLSCWRVPSRVWLGLPDPVGMKGDDKDIQKFEEALKQQDEVTLRGVAALSPEFLRDLAVHCMDKERWAKLAKRKATADVYIEGEEGVPPAAKKRGRGKAREVPAKPAALEAAPEASVTPAVRSGRGKGKAGKEVIAIPDDSENPSGFAAQVTAAKAQMVKAEAKAEAKAKARASSSALAAASSSKPGGKFIVPVPGAADVTVDGDYMEGETVVLTGVFPEIGGGSGLNLGKDKAKKMIEGFGGKVTSSISGKTTILLVGEQPGLSKVGKARASGKVTLMSTRQFLEEVQGKSDRTHTIMYPPEISSFSAGYKGNGFALEAAPEELVWAARGEGENPYGAKGPAPRKGLYKNRRRRIE